MRFETIPPQENRLYHTMCTFSTKVKIAKIDFSFAIPRRLREEVQQTSRGAELHSDCESTEAKIKGKIRRNGLLK